MKKQYKSLREFYPYYLTEHQNDVCRMLHFIGTGLFLFIVFYATFIGPLSLLWLGPVAGYGFAWVGHFVFEKNKPATFEYPAMSLVSDFIMFWHIATGQLATKMAQAKKQILNTKL